MTDVAGGDEVDLQSIADSEIPEIQREARDWLLANNTSDQRAILVFALGVAVAAAALQTWWGAVLAVCILGVLPFRWATTPAFRAGNIRRGIMWANLGTWYLLFPMVIIIPDTLPIAIQNVIGPMILAASYLERRLVKRLVPVSVALAVVVTTIGLSTDGVGLDDVGPRWVYISILVAYTGTNLLLVMNDLMESNVVRLRILRRAIHNNRELLAADQALRDSRRRLLVAADEERVRLERNLHDGAQQRLVSLSVQLRLAAELAEEGESPSSDDLLAMQRSAIEAVDEFRDLAQGVFPARLRELGLAKALHAVAAPIAGADRHRGRDLRTDRRAGAGRPLLRVCRGDPERDEARWRRHVDPHLADRRGRRSGRDDRRRRTWLRPRRSHRVAWPAEHVRPGRSGGRRAVDRVDTRGGDDDHRTAPQDRQRAGMRRVVIADDALLLRQGVSAVLNRLDGVEVVAEAEDHPGLMAAVEAHEPDLVITDVRMPPTHTNEGIAAAREIRSRYPDTGVIVLSQYLDADYVIELLEDGTEGLAYLLKENVADRRQLAGAIDAVCSSSSSIDPAAIEVFVQARSRRPSPFDDLTHARAGGVGTRRRGTPQQRRRRPSPPQREVGRAPHQLDLLQARPDRRTREQPPREVRPPLARRALTCLDRLGVLPSENRAVRRLR